MAGRRRWRSSPRTRVSVHQDKGWDYLGADVLRQANPRSRSAMVGPQGLQRAGRVLASTWQGAQREGPVKNLFFNLGKGKGEKPKDSGLHESTTVLTGDDRIDARNIRLLLDTMAELIS